MVPALAVAAGACTPIQPQDGETPLQRACMSPDTCVLDIFFVRLPLGDEEANGPLWDEIDEQRFPCELRRRLAQNGLRAGVVGGRMPLALARMLQLDGKPTPTGQGQQVSLQQMETTPTVVRRHLPIRPGRPREIVASEVGEQWDLLSCTAHGVCGQSYTDAQGVLAIEADPQPDGRVRIELVPELHYGEHEPRYVPEQYGFRLETSRSRRVFDELSLCATLTPEEMLVISSLPDRLASVGHHFFTQDVSGQEEQKLLVIRLSQTQHDELFSSDDVPPTQSPGPSANGASETASL
jgi:hypothetical protein